MADSSVGPGAILAGVVVYPRASVGRGCQLSWAIVEENVQVLEGTVVNGTASEAVILEGE